MRRLLLLTIVFYTGLTLVAQNKTESPKYGITFSGFVKNDFFFDTRQTVSAREGHFLLWPKAEEMINGEDINEGLNYNMLSVQSRLKGTVTGPDAFGAKTSGAIEVDFFAQANDNINLVRMRHAFVKMKWEKSALIVGQYWNPLFVTACFPGTVSFNTGVPIQPFARNPQIRYTHSLGGLDIMAAILSQRDYPSRGINGPSSEYLRNAGIPDMHFQLHYKGKLGENDFVVGGGAAYKQIRPEMTSKFNGNEEINEETLGTTTFIGFVKLKTKPITIKAEFVNGQNVTDVLSIGGFAMIDTMDISKGYTPFTTQSFWVDIHTNGKKFQAGIFTGMTQNMGTNDAYNGTPYGLGLGIDKLLRVSPRVIFNSGKTRVAFEVEYTQAGFGEINTETGDVIDPVEVANIRCLMGVYYFF